MNDIMYEKMIDLANKEKLVSIYSYDDSENFEVGFLSSINESHFIIKNISKNGIYNGYILGQTSNVCALGVGEIYLDNILKLYTESKRKHSKTLFKNDNLIVALLKYAMEKKYVVSIEINQSGNIDIQGIVVFVNETCIKIEKLNDNGIRDGIVYIDTNSIDNIYCNTSNEQKIKELEKLI